ncbi:MAG: DegT/DnrJ/EryC1/StrS family aminotransferase [Flavobacteriales bacterium]|nr:DegT/DnrJ/EryC1/StrS family aminotransferase [Flavobacteriales bacterium]
MKPIQLVDLHTQYLKIKEEIDKAVIDVIESTAFINGPEVKAFASDLESYLGVKHVIPCANGTDALQIALMALDVQPGDEILTPSFTYIATAEVIALLQLKPVFVEVDKDTFTIDIADAKNKVTSKTKAIIPVHLYGQCAQMDEVMAFAKENNLRVIEDTAQAIGSSFHSNDGTTKMAGCIGDIGTTSFFPSKNLGCYGDGGAIMTNDDALAQKLRMMANHGQRVRYYHDEIGCNSRLDSIQAAVLRIKLRHLNEYTHARQEVAAHYDSAFADVEAITTPYRAPYSNHGFHQYTMKLKGVDRDGLLTYLQEHGIPANIYYPVPVHLQKGYAQYGMKEGDMPRTEDLTRQVISLPIHTELSEEQLNHITRHIKSFING